MNKEGETNKFCNQNLFNKNKRGQVTIFIIIGLIIVVSGILIYLFYPKIKTTIGGEEKSPQAYIQSCIEQDIKEAVEKISIQGGSISPINYIFYNDTKIEYLCYTNEYYRPCTIQQPMLKKHIESEITKDIDQDVDACFNSLKENYEKRGYVVELKRGEKIVELQPNKISTNFNYSLTLTKGDTQRYDSFSVVLNNNLYELVSIANDIIWWENTYGDAEVTTYMTYNHNIKAEKLTKGSGERIYILTNRNTQNKFKFAVRSQAWPAGYTTITG